MSFFGKLFSGKDKENNESDYITQAYDSLGDEADLNPDRILDENSTVDGTRETVVSGDIGVESEDITVSPEEQSAEQIEPMESDIVSEYSEDDAYDALEIDDVDDDFDDDIEEPEQADVYDEDEAYGSLDSYKGDTDEMDVDELYRAMNRASEYAAQMLIEQDMDEDSDIETYGTEFTASDDQGSQNDELSPSDEQNFVTDEEDSDEEYDDSFGSLDFIDDEEETGGLEFAAVGLGSPDEPGAVSALNNDLDKEILYSAYAPKKYET